MNKPPFFNIPSNISKKALDVIENTLADNSHMNVRLIIDKHINKFVTGYLENGGWKDGKQSELKRQIYLLRAREIKNVLSKLEDLKKRVYGKQKEIIENVIRELNEYNVDEGFDDLRKLNDALRKLKHRKLKNKKSISILENVIKDIESIINIFNNIKLALPSNIFPLGYIEVLKSREEALKESLQKQNYSIRSEELQLSWRLVINLGTSSVYETSILLHRNYSIPYIPGSAIKGVSRHYTIQRLAEEYKVKNGVVYEKAIKKIDEAFENGSKLEISMDNLTFEECIEIFGTQKEKGNVIFFDAYPIIDPNVKDVMVLDVMNVHYRDYYQDNKPPGDWMNPNPVFFFAVEKGLKFRFNIASERDELTNKTMNLLREALKNIGVGAKTSAGYGYFGSAE